MKPTLEDLIRFSKEHITVDPAVPPGYDTRIRNTILGTIKYDTSDLKLYPDEDDYGPTNVSER